jgi:glycosyltransferase involved in cell wall biosynthesis|tara:strand:- start:3461 stop:4612 length:1152 start_codon:yes stop_codon:yes gene_type:complete
VRILASLTYYRPHVSGLTIYVERLARALVMRGHAVTVLTSQYDRGLPRREEMHGVRVVRVPVAARVSKGVLMPTIGLVASKLVAAHDALSVHLPQLDASGIALRGRLLRKPTVLTYHSDLILPASPLSAVVNRVVDTSNHVAAWLCDVLCAYTEDFARHSRLLASYLSKVRYILPPVEMPIVEPAAAADWATRHGLDSGTPVIGVAGRLAADKGIEILLEALPAVLAVHPRLKVMHAGPVEDVIGEERYRQRLAPILQRFMGCYTFLGTLEPDEMAYFFSNCDVHVLPSINSTESFGLVQIEAALCGTPTVASALPGVRVPTQMTGMGLTVPPRDVDALAAGIMKVLAEPGRFKGPRGPIVAQFSPDHTAARYEDLFEELKGW